MRKLERRGKIKNSEKIQRYPETSSGQTKKGKLPTSHCYNQVPLLRSRPGGFRGS